MENCQNNSNNSLNLTVSTTLGKCPIGEKMGKVGIENNTLPVISCEGACIRGEIARLAANYLSKHENFQRGCHGEFFTVPQSKIAHWMNNASSVICIDGCFLKCHSRIMEHLIDPSKLIVFDALSFYNKFNDIFDIDDVPEEERKIIAKDISKKMQIMIKENRIQETASKCSG